MCDSFVNWCAFSWEAFATLVTGLAAVLAAYVIGRKQIAIQNQSLKSDLFDKRLENYETVRDFLNSILSSPDDIDRAMMNGFFVSQREARFLFTSDVYDRLDEIWQLCGELNATTLEVNQQLLDGTSDQNLIKKKAILYSDLAKRYTNLHEVYAEMRLFSVA